LFHAVDEALGLGFQPGPIDAPGAADDGIQQPGMQASGLVTRQIHHDGDGAIDSNPRRPPNMLIHAEGPHTLESVRVGGTGPSLHLDRVPGGVPVHAQMSSQGRDSGVVVTQRAGCPRHRPSCQHHPGRCQTVGFAERPGRTRWFSAAPHPHQPAQQRDPSEARRIVQHPDSTAMADREYATGRAGGLRLTRLDGEHQPLLVVDLHIKDVHVGNIEDGICPGAPARTRTTHRVRHRRGFLSESLVASDPEGPDAFNP
jgi:hypothetical protein